MAIEAILEYLLGNGITTSLKSLSNFPVGQVGHQSVQKYCHLLMQIYGVCDWHWSSSKAAEHTASIHVSPCPDGP